MSYRNRAFIDKCSTTLQVDKTLWIEVTDNLFEAMRTKVGFVQVRGGNEKRKFQLYHFAWTLDLGTTSQNKEKCFIQAYPTRDPTSFMRIEWNPAKAGRVGIRRIIRLLHACIPNFDQVWENAFFTRVDVTFDVFSLNLTDIYAFTQSAKTKVTNYPNGFYLGVPKSERRLLIYDKRNKNIMDTAQTLSYKKQTHHSKLPLSLTRFEFRFLRLGPIRRILDFENQLSRYSITLKKQAENYKGGVSWGRFLTNCENNGAQSALAVMADQRRRAHYRDILNTYCIPDWYNKEIIWHEAMQQLWLAVRT